MARAGKEDVSHLCFGQCWRREPRQGMLPGLQEWLEEEWQVLVAGNRGSSGMVLAVSCPLSLGTVRCSPPLSCAPGPAELSRLYLAVGTEHLGAVLVLSQWIRVSARHAVLQRAVWQGKQ